MQRDRKNIGIIIIILGLIIIALIIYFFFLKPVEVENEELGPQDEQTQIEQEIVSGTTTPSDIPRNYQQYDISKEAEHIFNSFDLAKLSKSFAERFGSFTNQSRYENFTDLRLFMTDSFASWTNSYVDNLKKQHSDSINFYGLTTTALSAEPVDFDEKGGSANILVKTERREITNQGEGASYYQNLELRFKKVGSEWLVDAAYWEKL